MSTCMLRSIVTSSLSRLPCPSSTSLAVNPISHVKNKNLASYKVNILTTWRRSFVVSSNMTPPPEVPLPSGSPSGSMRNWIIGIVLTFVVPFFTHKWGPLLLLKNKVDTVVNTADHLAETIEAVSEKVDHVIDSITNDLPENSKLRKKLESIDELVEGVAKSAHIANDIIDKVEEVEDRLESLIIDEFKVTKQVAEKNQIPIQKPKVE